ncbi:MAG: hypothetical protein AABW68_05225 [archaeon]
MRDAQASLPDLILATFLFFILLAGLYYYSQSIQQDAQDRLDRRTLDALTSNLAEFIIKNPGTPTDWETIEDTNQIQQIGLAQKDRVLNPQKVVALINMGNLEYATAKQLLRIPYYEFHLALEGGVDLETGIEPPANKNTSVVQRLVTINGVETTFTLTLYDP